MFRELLGYDFYVPDIYFNKEELIRRKENKAASEKYVIPLKTFWRPLEMQEYYETNMYDKRFFKKVNAMENVEQTIGQYLPTPLRESILKT